MSRSSAVRLLGTLLGAILLTVGYAPVAQAAVGVLQATNFVVTQEDCVDGQRSISFSFDYTDGPDGWFIERNPLDEGAPVSSGSVSQATGSVSGSAGNQPAGTHEYALYGSRGGQPIATSIVSLEGCVPTPGGETPPPTSAQPTVTTQVNGNAVTVTVTNTDDGTDDLVSYDVTLRNKGASTGEVADGSSGSVTLTNVPAGTYTGTVTGSDGTTATFTVTVPVGQPADPVINPSATVTVNPDGSGVATFDNSKSTTSVGFELVINGVATLYSVPKKATITQNFSGAKPGSTVIVQDGEANELASAIVPLGNTGGTPPGNTGNTPTVAGPHEPLKRPVTTPAKKLPATKGAGTSTKTVETGTTGRGKSAKTGIEDDSAVSRLPLGFGLICVVAALVLFSRRSMAGFRAGARR